MDARILAGAAVVALAGGAAHGQAQMFCPECAVEKVATCGGFLEGLNVTEDGTIWAVDLFGNRILSIDEASGECTERGQGAGRPNGAKFAADGTLVLTEENGLMRFNPADGTVTTIVDSFEGEPLRELNDLSIAPDGGIYFTAPSGSDHRTPTGRVFYVAPDGDTATLIQGELAFPNGIAVAADGQRVFVGELARAQILVLPTPQAGGFRTTFIYGRTTGGIGPDGMTLGPDGTLYAAIFGAGAVNVFDPVGHPLGRIDLPEGAGTFTTNVAVHDGALYITEASLGEIWRVGLPE